MSVRLIAMDMDGTLLRDDKSVSPRSMRALRAAAEKGIYVVPASGRMLTFLPRELMDIPGLRYVITSNGAAVYELPSRRRIYAHLMDREVSARAMELIPMEKMMYEVYWDGCCFTDRKCYERFDSYGFPDSYQVFLRKKRTVLSDLPGYVRREDPGVEKINMPYVLGELRMQMWKKLEELGLVITSSLSCNLEANAAGTSKGDALLHLCGLLGISPGEAMALGDSGNDVEMLKTAGYSVAMANGTEEAKAVSRFVTASNEEDGVAAAIEKFAL